MAAAVAVVAVDEVAVDEEAVDEEVVDAVAVAVAAARAPVDDRAAVTAERRRKCCPRVRSVAAHLWLDC